MCFHFVSFLKDAFICSKDRVRREREREGGGRRERVRASKRERERENLVFTSFLPK